MLNLSSWPKVMRVIVRKERLHPGAQLRFTDWLCQPELAPLFSCDLAPPGVRRAGEFFFDLAPPGGPRSGGSETLLGRLPGDAQGGADGLP